MIGFIVTIIFIVAAGFIIFVFVMAFSPKLQGKMMSRQFKSMSYMMEESKDDLAKLSGTAVGIKKQILDKNEEILTDLAHKEANIRSVGIKNAAKAIKEGITETSSIYCKYCGNKIDSDSKFCKKCGKEQ